MGSSWGFRFKKPVAAFALISIFLQLKAVRRVQVVPIDDVKNADDAAYSERLLSPPINFTEPFANRWQRRFSSSESRGKSGGYLFFKHIRKAGGTSLRSFFFNVLEYHDQSRTYDLSPVAKAGFASGELDRKKGGRAHRQIYESHKKQTARKEKRKKNRGGPTSGYNVHYVEQEFDAMDWQCSNNDPRWNDSMHIITLRHPIERHLSEFFYSGPLQKIAGPGQLFRVDKTLLYENQTYTNELAGLIDEYFPLWMKENHAYSQRKKERIPKRRQEELQRPFGRFYTDNFQLRALAGCSSGDCLDDYDLDEEKPRMQDQLSTLAPQNTTNCTLYYIKSDVLFDTCHKSYSDECPNGCDGPCFYETMTRGPLHRKHLVRAMHSLESFDAVLMMDRLDDEKQADFLSDMFGVPRDAPFSLKNKESKNFRVEKSNKREKTHFYRDLLSNLRLDRLSDMLRKENLLEIELFKHAEKLNEIMIDQWEKETAGLNLRIDTAGEQNDKRTPPEDDSTNSGEEDQYLTANTAEVDKDQTETVNQAEDAHDYGVIVVMYHKTGYVLTRLLMKLTIGLEYEAIGYNESEVQKAVQVVGSSVDHVDEKTGVPIAFGQRGNWNRNFVLARRHHGVIGCQSSFKLSGGAIYLQEAPDFYCSDVDLAERMLGLPEQPPQKSGKAKIVHFVRNPFDMVLSNYFYHSADPTPEPWVHIDDPCEFNYGNGESLASHVLPTISPRTKITHQQLDAVVAMCQSLYQSKRSMKNATFYEHLLKLDHWDGLQLATAQMIISSSFANKHLAGGDILRMANNLIKFQNLLTSPSIPREQRENLHLLTMSMDDYIASPKNVTMKFLDFVLGSDDAVVSTDLRMKAAEGQERGVKRSQNGNHVTQGKHDDREELRQSLRDDSVLGPILSEVEILVNEALDQSDEQVHR
mmetsp:Transcript_8961/g.16417  ORF Transcript_8961/g.16417 Transcript_8961/m.16417 type:complete len:921 (-) Transcript_8961:271-3033(-)